MTDLRARMRTFDQARAPDYWSEVELRAATATPAARPDRGTRRVLILVTAVLVLTISAAVAVGSGAVDLWPVESPTPNPSPEALFWNADRAANDWPGPLRVEPLGVPIVVASNSDDPSGDVASEIAVVDIVEVVTGHCGWFPPSTCVWFEMEAEVPRPLPDPGSQWIAYGIVVDSTGDGQPDWRFGIDNASPYADHQRMWRTDLATGSTFSPIGRFEVPTVMDAVFPGDLAPDSDAPDAFPNSRTGSIFAKHQGLFHFYVWAAVIVDGQIVATDYAPDAGWFNFP
jgi:hypothetical protein